jgi:uncharacterized protein
VNKFERHYLPLEVRSEKRDGGTVLLGTAVVFNEWSNPIFGCFLERFASGSLDECLESKPDIFATIDHNPERLLGRTSSGTLRYTVDERGLHVECDAPDTTAGRDVVEYIRRKDIRGMSFIFDVVYPDGDVWERSDDAEHPMRTVVKANIYEVSFVTFPAYPSTDATLRSMNRAKELTQFCNRKYRQRLEESWD